jgi:polyhydroxybutyrate depolymerase
MLNFHGYSSNASIHMALFNDMRPIADTAGFIAIYPKGLLLLPDEPKTEHWNVGSWTESSTSDDIGFTEAIIDSIAKDYNIDLDRVYSCGYSNGGYFSFELACQLSDKIAAIGSVAGSMSKKTYDACNPSHPTPIVSIHGTLDDMVYYDGGNHYETESKSLPTVNEYWTNFNKTIAHEVISLPDINTSDNSTVELTRYLNGENCTSVEHYKVTGGKHAWPGSVLYPAANKDINPSKIIWDFVSKFDKNGLIGCVSTSKKSSENSRANTKVYPNPFSDKITFESNQNARNEFKLFNTLGEIVLTGFLNSERGEIDLSFLPDNIYFLQTNHQIVKIVKLNK